MGYFNDAFQCMIKAREFRRGFGREGEGDHTHKLRDAAGFIHTDFPCSCGGGSTPWLPRPNSPGPQDDTLAELGPPPPALREEVSIGDRLFGGVSGGNAVNFPCGQEQGVAGNAEPEVSSRLHSDGGEDGDMISSTGKSESTGA